MTGGPPPFPVVFMFYLGYFPNGRSGPRETYGRPAFTCRTASDFPSSIFGLFSVLWLLGLVFAFLSDFGLEESLPRSSLRLPTSGAG